MMLTQDLINVTHDEMWMTFNKLSFQILSHLSRVQKNETAVTPLTLLKTENGTTNMCPCFASVEKPKLENLCWILIEWYKHCTTDITACNDVYKIEKFLNSSLQSIRNVIFLVDFNVQPKSRFKLYKKKKKKRKTFSLCFAILHKWFHFKMRIASGSERLYHSS